MKLQAHLSRLSHVILMLVLFTATPLMYKSGNLYADRPTNPSLSFTTHFQTPVYKNDTVKPGLIIIPDTKGWLVSLYAPYFRHLSANGKLPEILAVNSTKVYNKKELKLIADNKRGESYTPSYVLRKTGFASPGSFVYPDISNNPTQAAIDIWKKYVIKSPDVVVASIGDFENFILASVFAAHFQIPLIPLDTANNKDFIKKTFADMQVKRVYQVSKHNQVVLSGLPVGMVSQLNQNDMVDLIAGKIGKANVKNVILTAVGTRQFDNIRMAEDALFYTPYISIFRNAPVAFSPSRKGRSAETVLNEYLVANELTPRNITILGDYSRIGSVEPDEQLLSAVYDQEIELEPGTNYKNGLALDYGIGRLPYNRLDRLSLYYTRLMIQNELYQHKNRDFVMISNLIASEGATLLFAEAVSKLTVKELRNFGLDGKSFYAADPENQRIWDAALNTRMVIYEGHSNHFLALGSDETVDFLSLDPTYFSKYPLLILQSCNSLEELEILSNKGPVAIVGSSTRVHSASGSSFIKTYLDSTLYESSITLGEALRDAKNYFLNIVELKKRRGHKEQSKANRVALSFRVWGDPEIVLFQQPLKEPKKKPVKINLVNKNTLDIQTPEKFYNYIENDSYRLRSFPMSKQAGIVKSSKNQIKDTRRIESFYFAKIPFDAFKRQNFGEIQKKFGMGDVRNIIMPDSLNRWVYFLHYPKKEKKSSTIQIKLEN